MPLRRALRLFSGFLLATIAAPLRAASFHVDPAHGDDAADGRSAATAWRSLARAQHAPLQAGDRLLLAAGATHTGALQFEGLAGRPEAPIVIGSYARPGAAAPASATIDGRGNRAALALRNSAHVRIEHLTLTADGGAPAGDLRCGVLVEVDRAGEFRGLTLAHLQVRSVSFHDPGFVRPAADVRTANGTLSYGWGIRFIVRERSRGSLRDLAVRDCTIERVDHTGLKFTAPVGGIRDVIVEDVRVTHSGGPGIQLSGVTGGRFARLTVDHPGSTGDTRNWGRGSGLWTWSSSDIVIERSRFTHANGPGDSAGVHIDYHCRNVVVQYNLSAHNAGGFCEILGDNRNCAYRYNVSVNDGHRVKGRHGAFQEGKTFWLSGYVGNRRKPTGPFDSYFYNNTIFVDATIVPQFAVAPTAEGVLVANNIFHLVAPARRVRSDQSDAERGDTRTVPRAVMANNLFLHADAWPAGLGFADPAPLFGDPGFARSGGDRPEDYIPGNTALVRDRGRPLTPLPGDPIGLTLGLAVTADILGRPIQGPPDLGAIEVP